MGIVLLGHRGELLGTVPKSLSCHVDVVYAYDAGRRLQSAVRTSQCGRLARTVRPDDADGLAFAYGQGQGIDDAVAVGVDSDVVELQAHQRPANT